MLAHWLAHVLGLDNASGTAYLAWSGAGGDLAEFAIAGALLGLIRKHNCEVHRCWRMGRHVTAAGHMVCRRHHPGERLTAEAVTVAHKDAETREGA